MILLVRTRLNISLAPRLPRRILVGENQHGKKVAPFLLSSRAQEMMGI